MFENNEIIDKRAQDIKKNDLVETNNGYSKIFFVYVHNYLMDVIVITPNHIISIIRNNSRYHILANEININDTLIGSNEKNKIIEIDYQKQFSKTKYFLTDQDYVIIDKILVSSHINNHFMGSVIRKVMFWINYISPCFFEQKQIIETLKWFYLNVIQVILFI